MKHRSGFTLVEMAVAIVIMGIIMALGVQVATAQMASTRQSATKTALANVKNAMLAFYAANHRFPCPDIAPAAGRDGIEDPPGGGAACANNIGTVPYVTIGIPASQALDAYGNYITYRVDTDPLNTDETNAAIAALELPWSAAKSYSIGDWAVQNNIAFISRTNANLNNPPPATAINNAFWAPAKGSWTRSSTAGPALANNFVCYKNMRGQLSVFNTTAQETANAVVVLISHGPNGFGAFIPGGTAAAKNAAPPSQPELSNTSATPTGPLGYRDYPPSETVANGPFGPIGPIDDMLVYIDSTAGAQQAVGAINTYMNSIGRTDICH